MKIVKFEVYKNDSSENKLVDLSMLNKIKSKVEANFSTFKVKVLDAFCSKYEGIIEIVVKDNLGKKYVIYTDKNISGFYIGSFYTNEGNETLQRIAELNS